MHLLELWDFESKCGNFKIQYGKKPAADEAREAMAKHDQIAWLTVKLL